MSSEFKCLLLVEGESDRAFFEQVIKNLNLDIQINIVPPKDLAGSHNSKEGVFNHLPILLKQLVDGQLARLAVIVDADSTAHGGGYQRTIDKAVTIVKTYGFELIQAAYSGAVFQCDGLANLGLWIMPNNQDEGMLEDWIKSCVRSDEKNLFDHAESVITALPQPTKFKKHHQSKAEVATWLAWQEKPGHGLYHAAEIDLLDNNSPLFQDLKNWLLHIFGKTPA